jgi:hypothetical protein
LVTDLVRKEVAAQAVDWVVSIWSRRRDAKPDDREWSAYTSVHPRMASRELVNYTALPAETGPTWAPDRLSVWPVEGGRYGIDAHYQGPSGVERANRQVDRLKGVGLNATVRVDRVGGLVRLGPLAHGAAWLAIEAFLGRPLDR